MELSKQAQQQVVQFRNLQQQLQIVTAQIQRLQVEKETVAKAVGELEKAEGKVYKGIGGILIETDKTALDKELKETREDVESKLTSLQRHQTKLKARLDELQEKIQKSLGGGSGAESNESTTVESAA